MKKKLLIIIAVVFIIGIVTFLGYYIIRITKIKELEKITFENLNHNYNINEDKVYTYTKQIEFFSNDISYEITTVNQENNAYYVLYNKYNQKLDDMSDYYDGVEDPETLKTRILNEAAVKYKFSNSALEKCVFKLFIPKEIVRLKFESCTINNQIEFIINIVDVNNVVIAKMKACGIFTIYNEMMKISYQKVDVIEGEFNENINSFLSNFLTDAHIEMDRIYGEDILYAKLVFDKFLFTSEEVSL